MITNTPADSGLGDTLPVARLKINKFLDRARAGSSEPLLSWQPSGDITTLAGTSQTLYTCPAGLNATLVMSAVLNETGSTVTPNFEVVRGSTVWNISNSPGVVNNTVGMLFAFGKLDPGDQFRITNAVAGLRVATYISTFEIQDTTYNLLLTLTSTDQLLHTATKKTQVCNLSALGGATITGLTSIQYRNLGSTTSVRFYKLVSSVKQYFHTAVSAVTVTDATSPATLSLALNLEAGESLGVEVGDITNFKVLVRLYD